MSLALLVQAGSWLLLALGSLFVLSGGVGLLRFPDFYTRTHAVGLAESAGAGLLLLGLLLQVPDWQAGVRLAIIVLFMLLTGPTAAQALAEAARKDRVRVWVADENRR